MPKSDNQSSAKRFTIDEGPVMKGGINRNPSPLTHRPAPPMGQGDLSQRKGNSSKRSNSGRGS